MAAARVRRAERASWRATRGEQRAATGEAVRVWPAWVSGLWYSTARGAWVTRAQWERDAHAASLAYRARRAERDAADPWGGH